MRVGSRLVVSPNTRRVYRARMAWPHEPARLDVPASRANPRPFPAGGGTPPARHAPRPSPCATRACTRALARSLPALPLVRTGSGIGAPSGFGAPPSRAPGARARAQTAMSYVEFLCHVHRQIQQKFTNN